MPKTTKIFDWEIYDKQGNFLDIISGTREDFYKYKHKFPDRILKEISYTDD